MAQGLAKDGTCTVYVADPGRHCGDNSDPQATGWQDCDEGVRKTCRPANASPVFVGGSMGAVMPMGWASEHPGQVAGLLMAPTTLRYDG